MFAIQVKHITGLSLIIALLLGIISPNAHAIFIDFDDIVARPAEPFDGCFCGHTLSNEYASQGLIFNGDINWLVGRTLPDGTNQNIVMGFNGISLEFVGALPNFVSFNINSPLAAESSYVDVYGVEGYLFTQVSSGWRGTEENSTPYIPDELLFIHANEGIASLTIYSLFGLRTGPHIDNLTFESRSVNEPAALFLFLVGFSGIFWKRMQINTNKKR
jgi:hypothetical protein